MEPVTAPIDEDAPDIVRVPVLPMCSRLPYYAHEQRWIFHRSICPQCSGDSCWPCPTGGALAVLLENAKTSQRRLARQN